jgi:hypothetical protein
MSHRFVSTIAIVACAGAFVVAAERATFILTTGERKAGPVVYHGSNNENLINGYLNLGVDNGPDLTFPIDQVAVIDFVGGRPPATELQAVGSGQSIALRSGSVEQGRFVNIIGGNTVKWQDQSGNTRDIPISQVSRIYLNPQSAMTAFRANRSMAVGTVGQQQLEPGAVRVEANQPWTSTGISVKKGDRISFRTTGQVAFARGDGQLAGPDGNDSSRNPAFPVVSMPVGGLIGKIGNGPAFAIGSNSQPLVMQTDGVLMLGVNDTEYSDNSGFFSVVVTKS